MPKVRMRSDLVVAIKSEPLQCTNKRPSFYDGQFSHSSRLDEFTRGERLHDFERILILRDCETVFLQSLNVAKYRFAQIRFHIRERCAPCVKSRQKRHETVEPFRGIRFDDGAERK